MIKWNTVTWYSKLAAIVFFILVLPVWTYFIGSQYGFIEGIESATSLSLRTTHSNRPLLDFRCEDGTEFVAQLAPDKTSLRMLPGAQTTTLTPSQLMRGTTTGQIMYRGNGIAVSSVSDTITLITGKTTTKCFAVDQRGRVFLNQ